ncbi:MAG: hypothetical protein HYV65_01185, partial [Candidatus Spechtbacteria bacterium]|nr:hypothetical protein [Candidatus Spechtbacteria bacterium]
MQYMVAESQAVLAALVPSEALLKFAAAVHPTGILARGTLLFITLVIPV